jgi:hypothetical protein
LAVNNLDYICEGLKVNVTVTNLDLSIKLNTILIGGNDLGDKGTKLLAEYLKVNDTLLILNLGINSSLNKFNYRFK